MVSVESLGILLAMLGERPALLPASLSERQSLFRALTSPTSFLVVLDNAATYEQVLPLLTASRGSLNIVTSRSTFPDLIASGASLVKVDPFDADRSKTFLRHRVGEAWLNATPTASDSIIHHCGGFPLASLER